MCYWSCVWYELCSSSRFGEPEWWTIWLMGFPRSSVNSGELGGFLRVIYDGHKSPCTIWDNCDLAVAMELRWCGKVGQVVRYVLFCHWWSSDNSLIGFRVHLGHFGIWAQMQGSFGHIWTKSGNVFRRWFLCAIWIHMSSTFMLRRKWGSSFGSRPTFGHIWARSNW
jgi:hypothetical protein